MTKRKEYYGVHFSQILGNKQINPYGPDENVWQEGETRTLAVNSSDRPIMCSWGYHAFTLSPVRNFQGDIRVAISQFLRKLPVQIAYVKLSGYPRVEKGKVCATTKTVLRKMIVEERQPDENLESFAQRLSDAAMKLTTLISEGVVA